ncbi:MAG TPA: hypothetical protein VKT80_08150, partial [Chloroflexota bacterium]|nr:hypothetical protein [Chloroflexota bacterium]
PSPSPAIEPAVAVGRVVVEPGPTKEPAATPTNPLAYTLGPAIALDGFDLSTTTVKPGGQVRLTLHWRDVAPLTNDFTVFVHILDATDKVVAQRDAQPGSGSRPTSSWFPGDVIVDSTVLELPPGVPTGTYPIEVGMYNPGDGSRLPVVKDGQTAGDRIILGRLEVVP